MDIASRRMLPQLLRSGIPLLLCFLATLAPPAAFAESRLEVRSATLRLDEGVYELDANLRVSIPEDARKAIDAGLTSRLEYEIEISRPRAYWLDAGIASLVQSYEVSYHALSQRYLLRNLNTGEQQDFATLNAVLEKVGEVRGLPVIDSGLLKDGSRQYDVRIRAVLDMGKVPDALRWLMFWTDDWSATSEWYEWTLRP